MANIEERRHNLQTICELHRKMYRTLVSRDPSDPLIPLLKQAFNHAKKMGNMLRRYKEDYDDGWYEIHKFDGGDIDKDP